MRRLPGVQVIGVALAATVLAACGGTGQSASRQSPTAAPSTSVAPTESSPSAAASPSPSPLPSPTPDADPSKLACRLPVVAQTGGYDDERGWITFPSGDYTRESAVNYGPFGLSYDWTIGSWVPVARDYVSPDGASYVIEVRTASGPVLYLVDAKTGQQRLISSGQGPAKGFDWEILAYREEGIYLGSISVIGETPSLAPGLWLLDPTTGHTRLVEASHDWMMIAGGVAWTYVLIGPVGEDVVGYAVYRLDLTTGQVSKSFVGEHYGAIVAPTTNGDVVVREADDHGSGRLFLLTRADQAMSIALPPNLDFEFASDLSPSHIGRPGVWLTLTTGIALYTKTYGLRVMARSPYGHSFYPMGDCR